MLAAVSPALVRRSATNVCKPCVVATSNASHSLLVEPDYSQFYMRRGGSDAWHSADVPSIGYERHLWASGTFVYVGTVRQYGTTAVRVEVLSAPPTALPDGAWQHVVEESLGVGGDLDVFSWPGGEAVATIPIPHEAVRLRVCWAGLDEDGDADEHLLVQIWEQDLGGPAVLRWWPAWELPVASDRSIDGRRQFEGLEVALEAAGRMELVDQFAHPSPTFHGSTQEHSVAHALYRDPHDGSQWAYGSDVRPTLREITDAEAAELRRQR